VNRWPLCGKAEERIMNDEVEKKLAFASGR
jgi:hypothetical protein